MRYHKIPDETIRRLPQYLRVLQYTFGGSRQNISSQGLADITNVNASQIRKDFSYFGAFGKPGVGYSSETLIKQISKILKLDIRHKTALIGLGNLGSALLRYPGFGMFSFDIAAVFDNNPKKIGKKINSLAVEDVSKIKTLKQRGIALCIIAVPIESAQLVADDLP